MELVGELTELCLESVYTWDLQQDFFVNHFAVQSNTVMLCGRPSCLQPPDFLSLSLFAWEVVMRP